MTEPHNSPSTEPQTTRERSGARTGMIAVAVALVAALGVVTMFQESSSREASEGAASQAALFHPRPNDAAKEVPVPTKDRRARPPIGDSTLPDSSQIVPDIVETRDVSPDAVPDPRLPAPVDGSDEGETRLSPEADADTAGDLHQPDSTVELSEQEQRVVGTWRMFRDGQRELVLRDDGTAVMEVNVESAWRFVVGENLRFDLEWQIDDDDFVLRTTGGEPAGSVDLIVQLEGSERIQPIVKLTDDRLILKDVDEGDPDHVWERVLRKTEG